MTQPAAVTALALNDPRVLQAALDWAMRRLALGTEHVRKQVPAGVVGQALMASQRRIIGMKPLVELPCGQPRDPA